jgi:hypothetical protein
MVNHIEIKAFPAHLAIEAAAVMSTISDYQQNPPLQSFKVQVRGEQLEIPDRVYYRESLVRKLAGRPGALGHIALCLGTRHCNGFLREECLKQLIPVAQSWVAPFVTQLIGEYVVEIVQVIERELAQLDAKIYGDYLNENAVICATISRRVVSYWNEYYRAQYPKLADYPAKRVLNALSGMAASVRT